MSDLGKGIRSRGTDTANSDQPVNPIPPLTDDPIAEYRVFIDALNHPSLRARWVRENQWRDHSLADIFNEFLSGLRPEQRELVAQMVELAEDVGTGQVLNVIDVYGIRLSRGGVELPGLFPYGLASLWGSWSCRKRGDAWPERPDQTFESIKDDD